MPAVPGTAGWLGNGRRSSLAILSTHPIQYFAPLYRRLAAQPDIDLTVYYCSRQGLEAYPDPEFGQTFRWDVPLLGDYRHRFVRNVRRRDRVGGFLEPLNPAIWTWIRRERPDALVVPGHSRATYLVAMAAARSTGTSLLLRSETHEGVAPPWPKRWLHSHAMRSFYGLFDAFLAIGHRNAEYYLSHGVAKERTFLTPYAVDNAFFRLDDDARERERRKVRTMLGVPGDRALLLWASKLVRGKRPMDALEAHRLLRDRGLTPALAFVGAGPERPRLERRAADQRIADVHFLGFRNQSELPALFAAADVFVMTSEGDTWGLVINEAMAARLPIVASREVGAVADLVREEENGLVFAAGDVTTLAGHLERLVRDADARERMGEASLRRIASWDLDRCVEGFRTALRWVCATRRWRGARA